MPRPIEQHQPTTSPSPIQTQAPSPQKIKKTWLLPLIGAAVAIIVIILTGYLTYSWQHEKIVVADNQEVILNKHISDQQQQIILLQETVPTLVPSESSYAGWTNYSLKYEKLSFQYPKSWKLSDTSANGSDNVSVTSLNNFVITINTGAIAATNTANPLKLIGFRPIDFAGKFAYFDFVSTANDGLVEEATLSQSPTNALQNFASKAAGEHPGTPGSFGVTAGYSSVGSNIGESQTLVNASKDASYQTAELLIESMTY
jgi:hypothetical protein